MPVSRSEGPSNILLDFLDRDGRDMWGTFRDFSNTRHRELLAAGLNMACFICRDYCVLPPVFLTLDPIVRSLLQSRAAFLDERIVRLPLKESSLDTWIEKSQRQYQGHEGWASEIRKPEGLRFLQRHAPSVIARESDVSTSLARRLAAGPDTGGFWTPTTTLVRPVVLEEARDIPRRLLEQRSAITWARIRAELESSSPREQHLLQRVLQHEYFRIYVEEFGLAALKSLPIQRVDFGTSPPDPYYDYECFKAALRVVGLDGLMWSLSARSVCQLRSTYGHHRFIHAYWRLTRLATNPRAVEFALLQPLRAGNGTLQQPVPAPSGRAGAAAAGVVLDRFHLEMVEEQLIRLATSAERGYERLRDDETVRRGGEPMTAVRQRDGKNPSDDDWMTVFVALREELEILQSRWSLTNAYGAATWNGLVGGRPVRVLCAQGAGRVRAAVAVSHFLSSVEKLPSLIVVLGIAGGFAETDGVDCGDVIVATDVADLGTRKVRSGADGDTPEFRTVSFACAEGIVQALSSGSFNERSWANSAAENFDYPRQTLPRIHYGTLISADEVVSSDEWRAHLLRAWPKACGVEMEAGGVMAAARRFGDVPVSVVRGVSDLANPLKADDEWRRRAMRAAALATEQAIAILAAETRP